SLPRTPSRPSLFGGGLGVQTRARSTTVRDHSTTRAARSTASAASLRVARREPYSPMFFLPSKADTCLARARTGKKCYQLATALTMDPRELVRRIHCRRGPGARGQVRDRDGG